MPNNPKPVILTQEGEQIFPLTDASLVTGLAAALAGKQDTISDLSTIRSGASAGATAYQKPNTGIPASDLAAGVIPTVPTDVVKYSSQSLTDAQKGQARANIGAGTYSKPNGGIPASDLASGVIPTIQVEDVTVDGTSVVSNKVAVIPSIPTIEALTTSEIDTIWNTAMA